MMRANGRPTGHGLHGFHGESVSVFSVNSVARSLSEAA
jgi:hypothetical protein